jgi:error-prone DNA polymerase
LWRAESAPEPGSLPLGEADPGPALPRLTDVERVTLDYQLTGVTTGAHPMSLVRERLAGMPRACELASCRDGQPVRVGGLVICRQRPGTANGHLFLSLEDETGIANAFVPCAVFERFRLVITQEPFLVVSGWVQNQDGVVSVRARSVEPLAGPDTGRGRSHDFH